MLKYQISLLLLLVLVIPVAYPIVTPDNNNYCTPCKCTCPSPNYPPHNSPPHSSPPQNSHNLPPQSQGSTLVLVHVVSIFCLYLFFLW